MGTRIMGIHRSKLLAPCRFYNPSIIFYFYKLGLSRGHNLKSVTHPKTRGAIVDKWWKRACHDWRRCMDPTMASAATLNSALTPSPISRAPSKNLTIGVYYYPWWYGADFVEWLA